jgi:putative peptidoglycan lipid II flippase
MSNTSTAKSTVTVMFFTLLSRIFGFIRIAVISALFGAGGVGDVINLTFSIPNNLRKLSAEGALSSAFIPVLSKSIVKNPNDNSEPKRIVRNLFSFQLVLLIPFCILSIIFARPLIQLVLAEFKDPWQIDLSVSLFRWFINYLLFISISAVIMGALNSSNHFMVPAVTPVLFSVCVISSIVILHKQLGVFSMAVGVLAGGAAQILFQLPKFKQYGFDLKPDFFFNNSNFKRILKQWLPVLATSSILTITQTVAFRFATGLAEGSTSAITNAIVFWQFPYGIFSASISTVLFPKMSRQIGVNDIDGLRNTIQYGMRYLAVLLIPSALFLALFGRQIIGVTIQRGLFTAENTSMTASVLTAYSLGLPSSGVYNFLQRYFYSEGNYRTPFIITSFVAVLDIIFSIWLKETFLGVTGLALANTISFTAGLVLLLFLVRKKLGYIHGKKILVTLFKVSVSMVPFIIFILIIRTFQAGGWEEGSNLVNLLILIGGFGGSCVIILGMYRIMKIEILQDILSIGRKR